MNPCKVALTALCLSQAWLSFAAAEGTNDVRLVSLADRVRVEIGGQLFTEYIYGDGASRPYCYPILATDGTPMTRNFPMKRVAGEETDHPWHRSLFFEHSSVGGVDFWNEGTGDAGHAPAVKGKTVWDSVNSNGHDTIHSCNNWISLDGRFICTDERTVSFHATPEARMIDYQVTLHALTNAPLVIGDNKDGTMALRLAQWMTLPHKSKLTNATPSAGHIVTSTGQRDNAAWGKRADWCDYYAEHDGKIYGVAIFDHPDNLRHPTWWMARDYGLFGANPFGQHEFENLKDQPHAGDYTIPAGGSLTLRYRFYFHNGDEKAADITGHYAEYVAGK